MASSCKVLSGAALFLCAACGGKLVAPADREPEGSAQTGGDTSSGDGSGMAANGVGSDASAGSDGPDAPPPACAPVKHRCLGAASCDYNDDPMPLACTGAMTCHDFCVTMTGCDNAECRVEGDTFRCYTCAA